MPAAASTSNRFPRRCDDAVRCGRRGTRPRVYAAALLALVCAGPSAGDESSIPPAIAEFFAADSPRKRAEIAQRIESTPGYDRAKVSGWLHAAGLFAARKHGRATIDVVLADGQTRAVALIVPRGYDASRAYPLIYALHGQGGDADSILRFLLDLLGERADEFLLAAPDRYAEAVLHHSHWPPLEEHAAALRAVRAAMHVDSDRVHVFGYSRGGHTTWSLALSQADEFASATPIAGTFLMEQIDLLWEDFLPTARHLPILAVWGRGDTMDDAGNASPQGGIAGLNRRLVEAARAAGVPVRGEELPDKGHADVVPGAAELWRQFEAEREPYPRAVEVTFRHLGAARAYWLEAEEWAGPQWTAQPPTARLLPGEDIADEQAVRAAGVRAIRGTLGKLRGEIRDQTVEVYRKNVRSLTVWFGDGMIDWSAPVAVTINGRKDFEGLLRPDLLVCLNEAARTRDLDRLRWAGLRVRTGRRSVVVDGDTPFRSRTFSGTESGE